MLKPDKKGRPMTKSCAPTSRNRSPEEKRNVAAEKEPGNIFISASFNQDAKPDKEDTDPTIRAINVSRSPYDDPMLAKLPNKISNIKKANNLIFNGKQDSKTSEARKPDLVAQSVSLPTKESKSNNRNSKNKAIKNSNNGKPDVKSKKPVARSKSPVVKSPYSGAYKSKLESKSYKY